MSRASRASAVAFLALAALTTGCGSDPICDPEELAEELEDAEPGDTVEIGACEVTGSFVVPEGVTLRGAGKSSSRVTGISSGVALTVAAGSQTTVVRDLAVVSSGTHAVSSTGAGAVAIEHVDVRVTRGAGIVASDLAALTLTDVSIVGPVTPANVGELPPEPDASTTAAYGLVASGIGSLTASGLTARGFAVAGVLLVDTTASWSGGGAIANASVGLGMVGGIADLADVSLSETLAGTGLYPAFGGIVTDGAELETRRLSLHDSEGYGLLHVQSDGSHIDLSARDNADAALWVQTSKSFTLGGTGTSIENSGLAGLVVLDSENVSLSDGKIVKSKLVTRVVGTKGAVQVGDGVHLVDVRDVRVQRFRLSNNARTGLLLDLGGIEPKVANVTFSDVVVEGTGTQLGAVGQTNGALLSVESGWDVGIVRKGAVIANDGALSSPLETLGAVSPEYIPALTPELVSAP